MTLMSLLGKNDRILRRYCKKQLAANTENEAALAVIKNFSVLSSAINSAKGFLSRYGEEGLLPLFFMCKKFMSGEIPVNAENIIAYFSAEGLSVLQCEALSELLFAAGAVNICELLHCGDKEKISALLSRITALRDADFMIVLSGLCRVEKYLSRDPSGVYLKMSAQSRRDYRLAVMQGAEKRGCRETDFAAQCLNSATEDGRHIGFYLPLLPRRTKKAVALTAFHWLLSVAVAVFSGLIAESPLLCLILCIPTYFALMPLVERLGARLFPPFSLPCLADENVPDVPFVITVCTLLPDKKACESLYFHLKRLKFSSKNKNVSVALLCDRKNFSSPEREEDRADISALKGLIDRLNSDFGGGFSALVRDRVYSVGEGEYTGFERKRGAVCEFMRLIKNGDAGSFSVISGDTASLRENEYMLVLDSDTELSLDAPDRLLAVACHPLNKPVFSRDRGRIVAGYGIIIPRAQVSLQSSEKSLLSQMGCVGGSLAYAPGACERFFAMTGRSVFTGKGLISIDAFLRSGCDRFEEGRILSHDVLEGSVLSTGFCGRAEITESCPATLTGYFSRLHRWIRGDVQNLKYLLCPTGKDKSSPRTDMVGKYVILENYLRAIAPVYSAFLLIFSLFLPAPAALACSFAAFLSVTAPYIFEIFSSLRHRGFGALLEKYICGKKSALRRAFCNAVLSLSVLPAEVFVRCDAVIRAFFRSLVTKKRLLQWKTAAAADKNERKFLIFAGAIITAFSVILMLYGNFLCIISGVLMLAGMPFVIKNKPRAVGKESEKITDRDREILHGYIGDMWKLFRENVTEKNNFLPPDNVWDEPSGRVTARTSPTNIGLYLTSALAVYDAGIISGEELLFRVNKTLDTVERLPKFKGQLYNWYNTVSGAPVSPLYVSQVDCGNFLVCLTALKEGLREIEGSSQAVERIEKILSSSDLSFFGDFRRGLFRIGFDSEGGELTPSCYDLYMSEARMSSYFAVARRQVPVQFWERLGRGCVQCGGYSAPAAWSGTMFEYFMPALFLEHPPFSFAGEGLRVSLFAQKKSAEKYGIPYGFSESCFYDGASPEGYGYRALGSEITGIKGDMHEEAVVSPYSVFISLIADARGGLENLRWLKELGAYGSCGFYEACDFRENPRSPRIIRCFMAHHTGMSIVAAVNVLYDGIFIRRFMRDFYMDNARGLLYEQLAPFQPREDSLAKKCRKKL